jgi:hypothetical protein
MTNSAKKLTISLGTILATFLGALGNTEEIKNVDLEITSILLVRPRTGAFEPRELSDVRVGERITFAFWVRNNGTDPSNPFGFQGNVDGLSWEFEGIVDSSIGPSEEKRFLVAYENYADLYDPVRLAKFYETQPGEHTVTFVVDVYNQNVETNEANNEKSLVFSGKPWQEERLLEFLNLGRKDKNTNQDLDLTDRIGFTDYSLIQKYWQQTERPLTVDNPKPKMSEAAGSSEQADVAVWEEVP